MSEDEAAPVEVSRVGLGEDGALETLPGKGLGRLDVGERFALGARIGKGGMGEVFAAQDERLNRELAIKVLGGGVAERSELAQRFIREAQITAQLSHPNVIPVFSLEQTDEYLPALTMKLVRGGTFQDYVAECASAEGTPNYQPQRHSLATRVEHFLKVCDAMAYSHSRGVIHRDIKPENLMLGSFGEVYVMDWGLARIQGTADLPPTTTDLLDEGAAHETQHGMTLGTMRYMSPEQLEGDRDLVGPASDQFALGMTLFELVTLQGARDRQQPLGAQIALVDAGGRHTFADLGLDRTVPRGLQAIVDKATAPIVEDRYESVDALGDDLRSWLHGEEVQAWPDSPPRRVWRRLQKHPVKLMSALLAIVLVAAGVSITSLVTLVESERQSAESQRTLATLMSTVSRRVQEFDRTLSGVEILLEGLAVRSRDLIADDDAPRGTIITPVDLAEGRGPADTRHRSRWDQLVTVDRPIYHFSHGTDREALLPFAERLVGLEPFLREVGLRSAGEENVTLPRQEREDLLQEGVPLIYVYAAFENGVMISWPGTADYPEEYDARKRPWYTGVKDRHGPHWGELYNDATGSGFLLPCNRALYDDDGAFIGVAGSDLSMDVVIEDIEITELAGVRESFLLDAAGKVIIRGSEHGARSERSLLGNKAREHTPIGVPELEEQIQGGAITGFTRTEQDLWVFARLETVPWLLAVQLDPAAHEL